jgi:hypothetical protein
MGMNRRKPGGPGRDSTRWEEGERTERRRKEIEQGSSRMAEIE